MFIVAITAPSAIPYEAEKITSILREGKADVVHIRKPHWDACKTAGLIEAIPIDLWKRLKIHDNFELIYKYPLGGVHLNSRNKVPPKNALSVSKSMHSIDQLSNSDDYDYVTLSPVFDSISKRGYHSAFSLTLLKHYIKGRKVVALGGVTPDKFHALSEAGFWGAAMLGYFWND